MNEQLLDLMSELLAESSVVRADFDNLFDPGIDTVPIPFFGNLLKAKVVTVGVNPSDGEIRYGHWPRPVDLPTLYKRLTEYFSNPQFPPYPWFASWTQALRDIGISYAEGNAVHIDICPWPTRPKFSKKYPDQFEKLVTQNVSWFWRCLQQSTNLRLVLIAGSVNNKHYINEFLIEKNHVPNTALIGKIPRGGTAFVGYHQLCISDQTYPVFFCSVSPSARNHSLLPERVHQNRDRLIEFLS